MCVPGQYCPTGSGAAVSCDPGNYCWNYLLTAVSGLCAAGYYCPTGSKDEHPNDLTAYGGTICPVGSYCAAGSSTFTQCAIGTYLNAVGNDDVADCMSCPAGFFCDTLGLADYTANTCPPGYFCPLGTSVSTANPCTPGHYCPGGTHDEIICDAGTFQDLGG